MRAGLNREGTHPVAVLRTLAGWALAAALAVAAPALAQQQPPEARSCERVHEQPQLFARYLDVVGRYRSGSHEVAVAEVLAWETACVDTARFALKLAALSGSDFPRCADDCVRAAALLHTEAAIARRPDLAHRKDALLDAGAKLVAALPTGTRNRWFAARWHVLAGSLMHEALRFEDALSLFEKARHLRPEDARVLVAIGALHQEAVFLGTSTRPDPSAHVRRIPVRPAARELGLAEEALRAAVRLDPALEEGHLRLAHVLLLQDRKDEASRELAWLLEQARDGPTLLNARLLRGCVLDSEGHVESALEQYRAAAGAVPSPRTAQLAVGAAHARLGDRRAAMAAARAALAPEASAHDPWLSYRLAYMTRIEESLALLRLDDEP